MSFRIVIPARYASTRLPGKPLADIGGKPMVVRVAEAAAKCGATEVLVATDDARVLDAVQAHGHLALMTHADHPTGTDRLAEVAALRGWSDDEIVVNVQGDEPQMDATLVCAVAEALANDAEAAIATAAHALHGVEDFFNPNIVKVVVGEAQRALYFSRAPIPWPRDAFAASRDTLPKNFPARRHIGLYAYRVGFLKRYGQMTPAPVEQWEALEQLRALAHGYVIKVVDSLTVPPAGIDTPEDLERVRQSFVTAV